MRYVQKGKCKVKWNDQTGIKFNSKFGVLQGGMLSPNLLTEFLSDLNDYLDKNSGILLGSEIMTYILYADDLILCSENEKGLLKLLDGLYNFCKKWHHNGIWSKYHHTETLFWRE